MELIIRAKVNIPKSDEETLLNAPLSAVLQTLIGHKATGTVRRAKKEKLADQDND